MATTLNSSLFSSRYRDDFRDSDHFHRILFNSGRALQARELTQMQTIIQKEIERFGRNIFKDGAAVDGSGVTVDNKFEFVKLNTSSNPLPANKDDMLNVVITGASSGITAKVLRVEPVSGSDPATLYVQYISTSTGTSGTSPVRFTPGETLNNATQTLVAQTVNTVANPAVGAGTKASVTGGIFFTQGHFVSVDQQTIIVSRYTSTPSTNIGFKVVQDVVSTDDDTRLYDNQGALPNTSAPGADRYRIRLTLIDEADITVNDIFVFYAKIVNGVVRENVTGSQQYNKIAEFDAVRVHEINGDFIKNNFILKYDDHPTDNTKINLDVSPGLAYINGYRIDVPYPTLIEANKALTSETISNNIISAGFGNYVNIDSAGFKGIPNINEFEKLNLRNAITHGGSTIGTARIKSVEENGASFKWYLMDVQMNAGETFRDVKSIGSSTTNYGDLVLENNNAVIKDPSDNLLFRAPYSRIKSMSGITYTAQFRHTGSTDGSGNISLPGLSAGEAYTDANDWIFAETASGDHFNPTVAIAGGGLSATVSGGPTSVSVEIIYKKQITATVRTKTLTNTTVTASITVPATGVSYIDLGKADVISVSRTTLVDSDGVDVSSKFILDNGQRDNFYAPAKLLLKTNASAPTGNIFVRFDYLAHGASGDFFSANSYAGQLDYSAILTYTLKNGNQVRLTDVLDFRSRQDDTGSNFTGGTARYNPLPTNTSLVTADIEYYLPRRDKLVLNSNRNVSLIEGQPSFQPQFPITPGNALELYQIEMNAATVNDEDMSVRAIDAKGFTMKDIARLERRLENLEETTALSLLEVDLKNFNVLDGNGVDRTKSGFLVDNFVDQLSSDTRNNEYRAAIDPSTQILRAAFNEEEVRMVYDSSLSTNTILKGDNVYIKYDNITYIDQPQASGTENINPFAVITHQGNLQLSPGSDYWKETRLSAPRIISGGTRLDTSQALLWNNWNWNWQGVPVGGSVGSVTERDGWVDRDGFQEGQARATVVNRVVRDETIRQVIGERVIDVAIIPFQRSIKVYFKAQGLRENTKHFPFYDNVDVSSWVANSSIDPFQRMAVTNTQYGNTLNNATAHPDTASAADRELISNASGEIEGSFVIPNTSALRFRTGSRELKFVDVTSGIIKDGLSHARERFVSAGQLETVEQTIRSTRVITIAGQRFAIEQNDRGDPLAQSFFVEEEDGIFLTKVDVYFATKDATVPVQLQVRPMINGIPSAYNRIPNSVKFLPPANVNTSGDASVATTFEFDEPIFLEGGTEYCIVLLAETVEYNVYVAETEQFVLGSTAKKITKQPTLGSLFKSQNGFTWDPAQTKDLMFKLYRAEFDVNGGTAVLENAALPNYLLDIDAFSGSANDTTIIVSQPNHGFINGDIVNITGLDSSTNYGLNHLPGSLVNGLQTVDLVDENNWTFEMSTTSDSSFSFGDTNVLVERNIQFETIVPFIETLIPGETDITINAKFLSAKSQAGAESQYNKDNAFTRLALRENNFYQVPKMIANPRIELAELGANVKSATIEVGMSTLSDKVSPMLDMQRASIWLIHNNIDRQDSANSYDVINNLANLPLNYQDETAAISGTHLSKHIVKPVTLENSAVGIKVLIGANKPSVTEFDLYYKAVGVDDNFEDYNWTLALPEETLPSDENPTVYRDYTYLIGGTAGLATSFDKFTLKIVMRSKSSAKVPTFKDLRVIALAV